MKRFLLIFALMLPLWSAVEISSSTAAEQQTLVVGGDHENPPYEFLENGKATGFNVEVMREVAESVGAEVEFRLGPWGEVRTALEQGRIDALAGMYYSEERSRLVDFSVPHTMVSAGLFVRDASEIQSIEDLKGKEIIAQKGDVIDDYLRREQFASRIIEVKDPADELRLLASGKHDCALMPSLFQGEYLIRELGISGVRGMSVDLPQLRYCFAVRKGNDPLRYRLDEGLNLLKLNGKYQDIYEKWFGVYEKGRLWSTVRYFVWALAIIAILLAASSIWSWFLRREVRKRTAELRDREEKLRFTQFAIDNATDQAFWMTDRGRLCYVNDAACRTLGYLREELLTLSIPDIDPIFQPERFAEHWRDLQENGSATFETFHKSKDGRVYPVEIRANYVVFDGREYNCAFVTDISERKRAEEALRESEEKFRVLAETSPAAIFLYQGKKNVYVSPSAYRLTGYTERDFLEMNFWDIVHEDFREMVKERGLARLRGESVPSQYEIKIVANGGEEKWLYISAGRIDYRGNPAGIVTMFDVTDRKRMEEELQHAYDDLERQVLERTAELREANLVVENSPVVLFRWKGSDEWPVEMVSRNVVQFGYEPEEFLSRSITYSSIIHPADLERVTQEVHDICDGGGDLLRLEYRIMTKEGEVRWVNEITRVERDPAGSTKNFEGVVIDITERKLAEENLKLKKLLLEELNLTLEERVREEVAKNREKDIIMIQQNRQAALGEILDHIVHQWKQPLNSLSLTAYLLKEVDTSTNEEVAVISDKVLDLVENMAQTINVFRDFYRPDKQKTLFSIEESINRALSFIGPAMKIESIALQMEIDHGLKALGYPKEFAQVILNLVGNAREAIMEKKIKDPKVTIKGYVEDGMVVVTVSDNAGGIDEKLTGRIFDLDFTTKETSGGTGIGLYMSKNIIEGHMGGKLTVENKAEGARFKIMLASGAERRECLNESSAIDCRGENPWEKPGSKPWVM